MSLAYIYRTTWKLKQYLTWHYMPLSSTGLMLHSIWFSTECHMTQSSWHLMIEWSFSTITGLNKCKKQISCSLHNRLLKQQFTTVHLFELSVTPYNHNCTNQLSQIHRYINIMRFTLSVLNSLPLKIRLGLCLSYVP